MHKYMAYAVVAASCFLASSPAMAAEAKFTIFEDNTIVASYIQSTVPTPIFYASGEGATVSIHDATGLLSGDTFLNYFSRYYAPKVIGTAPEILGGIYDEKSFYVGFVQVYTYYEYGPYFYSGFLTGGTDEFNGNAVTVVVSPPIIAPSIRALVSFNIASPVPEPGAWAMMLIGMGVIGFGIRRRRKAVLSYT